MSRLFDDVSDPGLNVAYLFVLSSYDRVSDLFVSTEYRDPAAVRGYGSPALALDGTLSPRFTVAESLQPGYASHSSDLL